MLYTEAGDCIGDVIVVPMYLYSPMQAVSMMEKTGFSASGIEASITVYTLAPCIAKTIIFNWKGLSHECKGIILAVA